VLEVSFITLGVVIEPMKDTYPRNLRIYLLSYKSYQRHELNCSFF